jgi:hypothetical protein
MTEDDEVAERVGVLLMETFGGAGLSSIAPIERYTLGMGANIPSWRAFRPSGSQEKP